MNGRLTNLSLALGFALMCGWAAADAVSAQGASPKGNAVDETGVEQSVLLPWLEIMIEGDREAAQALKGSELGLVFKDSASGETVEVNGVIELPYYLQDGHGDAVLMVHRYPMVLHIDRSSGKASRLHNEFKSAKLRVAESEDEIKPQSYLTIARQSYASLDWNMSSSRSEECVNRINAVLGENNITFASDSEKLDQSGLDVLDRVAKLVAECDGVDMEIGGHTDATGSRDSNLDLSQKRAEAVRKALANRGYPEDQFIAKGYGESCPLADNETEKGRLANRRIHFSLAGAQPAITEGAAQKACPENEKYIAAGKKSATANNPTPIWVVYIEAAQYCPLVNQADVRVCDGFDAIAEEAGKAPTDPASAEDANEGAADDGADVTSSVEAGSAKVEESNGEGEGVAEAEANAEPETTLPTRPEPVDYKVKINLAFAGSGERTYGTAAKSLQDMCDITFMVSGDAEAVAAEVDFRAVDLRDKPKPLIEATSRALRDVSIDLSGANLRFEQDATEALEKCTYEGAVVALDEMLQVETMITGVVVLPAQKPGFDLIYDLSGEVIGDDPSRSGKAVVGFASRVADALGTRLTNAYAGAQEDYFVWIPSNSIDPTLVPMSVLDTDGSAAPNGTQYLHTLNESVRVQMLERIEESVGGVRSTQLAEVLDQVGESSSKLLEAGDVHARAPNLRVLVQVARTARSACLDASTLKVAPNADIRPTMVKRIVAVAESQLLFDPELTEQTRDSLIWRCKTTESDLVDTWLVPLSDVERDRDWQALTDQVRNLKGSLVP